MSRFRINLHPQLLLYINNNSYHYSRKLEVKNVIKHDQIFKINKNDFLVFRVKRIKRN